jgi:thioredoxin-like negative regulator of GroEL
MAEIVIGGRSRAVATKRRRWLVPSLVVIAGGLLWSGWRWREARLLSRAIAEAREDLDQGLNARAARKLVEALLRNPESDEANYLLGVCEKARGRPLQAIKAWARVPPASPFAPRAIQGRVEVEIERGRLADAEQIVLDAGKAPGIDGSGLGLFLGPIYGLQGRTDEARRFVEVRWDHLNRMGEGASEEAIHLARLSNELHMREIPVLEIRSFLDRAAASAPDDDRTWLGRANLAIRVGSYSEAQRWLDACLERRPRDAAVWRARLDWALATDRVDEVRSALEHLPASASTPAQVQRLAAWLAARGENVEVERRALERLVAVDPADSAAFERLAELADLGGEGSHAAELRSERAEIDLLKERYQQRYRRNQPLRDASEMARLAERLGRWFEAEVFLTVATVVDDDRDDLRRDLARLRQRRRDVEGGDRTLADVLAIELGGVQDRRPVP